MYVSIFALPNPCLSTTDIFLVCAHLSMFFVDCLIFPIIETFPWEPACYLYCVVVFATSFNLLSPVVSLMCYSSEGEA